MKTLKIFLLFLVVNSTSSFNLNGQSTNFNKEVNKAIWVNFASAYETLDINLFESLHSDSFIRVSGNSKTIRNKKEYIDSYTKWWQDKNLKLTISFRFLERINNGEKASERGIYKLVLNANTEKEASYYGEFHVIIRKEDQVWKLLIDYDSNPNDEVGENAYLMAQPQE